MGLLNQEFSDREKKSVHTLRARLLDTQSDMTEEVKELLSETIFQSEYTFHPRDISKFAHQITDSLFLYLKHLDETIPFSEGQKIAAIGMSVRTALSLGILLRQFCDNHAEKSAGTEPVDLQKAVDSYTVHFVEGYIEEKELRLLDEQEKIHRAFVRAHLEKTKD